MKILVVDNHSRHINRIARLFPDKEVITQDCDDFSSESAKDFDMVVLSGGSHVYAAENVKKAYEIEIEFIKTTEKPVIGICLGCQLIAKAFGGSLEKLEDKKSGIYEITFQSRKYKVYESHRYTIKSLPEELQILASSETGTEIIKHKSKEIFGFQFHPEVFPRKTDGKKLFDKVINKL